MTASQGLAQLFQYKRCANQELLALGAASQGALPADDYRLFVRILNHTYVVDRMKDWPHASTSPHGGRYDLKLDSQPQAVTQSAVIQNLSVALPGQHAALEDRADAIVRLDAERGEAADAFAAARRIDLSRALEFIDRQAEESVAFLSALTRYNLSIAQYALTVLGPTDPDLAGALVVKSR